MYNQLHFNNFNHLFLCFPTEPSHRGKGIGKEVMRMMMCYGKLLTQSVRIQIYQRCCFLQQVDQGLETMC